MLDAFMQGWLYNNDALIFCFQMYFSGTGCHVSLGLLVVHVDVPSVVVVWWFSRAHLSLSVVYFGIFCFVNCGFICSNIILLGNSWWYLRPKSITWSSDGYGSCLDLFFLDFRSMLCLGKGGDEAQIGL